jgi:hypothetical protein
MLMQLIVDCGRLSVIIMLGATHEWLLAEAELDKAMLKDLAEGNF